MKGNTSVKIERTFIMRFSEWSKEYQYKWYEKFNELSISWACGKSMAIEINQRANNNDLKSKPISVDAISEVRVNYALSLNYLWHGFCLASHHKQS